MRASPLQLRRHFFTRFELSEREHAGLNPRPEEEPFDFDGVLINTGIECGTGDGQGEDPTEYALRIGVSLGNKTGKRAPYNLFVEALGYFSVDRSVPVAQRKSLVVVTGASLLYGAIREMVMTVSARSARGMVVLPTVSFIDLRKRIEEEAAQETSGTGRPKKVLGERKVRPAPARRAKRKPQAA